MKFVWVSVGMECIIVFPTKSNKNLFHFMAEFFRNTLARKKWVFKYWFYETCLFRKCVASPTNPKSSS